MKYTFGKAKEILSRTCHSKMEDIGEKINCALRALCDANPWEHEFLRQVVRMSSVTPTISLPQGATGLVRACVNGKPTTLHGQDVQFLSSGPGDLDCIPGGYQRLGDDILDLGTSPVWIQPSGFGWLCATYKGSELQPPVTVYATGMDGDRIEFNLTPQSEADPLSYDKVHPVRTVERVVLDPSTDNYISLYMTEVLPANGECLIARYHPSVPVPEFRRYRLPSLNCPGPYDILAEVQFEPLDLVDDTDVIPIPTLEPIKSMILYEHSNQNLETEAADRYLKQAQEWIARANSRNRVVQTQVNINVPYEGSMGQLSDFYDNL